jgi:proteasome lid subunit RPN8/RPN11
MIKRLCIPRPLYAEMLAHLQGAYPLEACGLMAGEGEWIRNLYPVDNILASPTAYEMDPHQQVQAMLALEEKGWELAAIYHSHPQGPEVPSLADVGRAYYPQASYIIVSLQERARPTARAFAIVEGRVYEIPLEIV